MRLEVEKGRMMGTGHRWIHFTLRNTDIMTSLNKAPLKLERVDDENFKGKFCGTRIALKVLGDKTPSPRGDISIVADVQAPMWVGRTHTVVEYRYNRVEDNLTAVDLKFELVSSGPIMSMYMLFIRASINSYLKNVMSDNERAAILMQEDDPAMRDILTEAQLKRIAEFRDALEQEVSIPSPEALMEKLPSELVPADKTLWDSELLELSQLYAKLQGKTARLEDELDRIHATQDAVATLLIARRMLELIVGHVCQHDLKRERGSEPLAGVIDKINRANCAPEYVITSMSNLNRLSTYGAHPKDFSPRQVREALIALCSIMEWYGQYCRDAATDPKV